MPIDIIAMMTPKPGKADQLEKLLVQAAAAVKATEPGTTRFHLQKEAKGDTPTFIMLETYKDKAAIEAHSKSENFKKMGKALKEGDLLAGPMKIMVTKEVGGYASKL